MRWKKWGWAGFFVLFVVAWLGEWFVHNAAELPVLLGGWFFHHSKALIVVWLVFAAAKPAGYTNEARQRSVILVDTINHGCGDESTHVLKYLLSALWSNNYLPGKDSLAIKSMDAASRYKGGS